jgi:hypothetical protein
MWWLALVALLPATVALVYTVRLIGASFRGQAFTFPLLLLTPLVWAVTILLVILSGVFS